MGPVRPQTQCSTDVHTLNAVITIVERAIPQARHLKLNLGEKTGKTCVCVYDQCNGRSLSELSALVQPGTIAITTVSTSTSKITARIPTDHTVNQTHQHFRGENGDAVTDVITRQQITAGITGNNVKETAQSQNVKPIIRMWLLSLCFVITFSL